MFDPADRPPCRHRQALTALDLRPIRAVARLPEASAPMNGSVAGESARTPACQQPRPSGSVRGAAVCRVDRLSGRAPFPPRPANCRDQSLDLDPKPRSPARRHTRRLRAPAIRVSPVGERTRSARGASSSCRPNRGLAPSSDPVNALGSTEATPRLRGEVDGRERLGRSYASANSLSSSIEAGPAREHRYVERAHSGGPAALTPSALAMREASISARSRAAADFARVRSCSVAVHGSSSATAYRLAPPSSRRKAVLQFSRPKRPSSTILPSGCEGRATTSRRSSSGANLPAFDAATFSIPRRFRHLRRRYGGVWSPSPAMADIATSGRWVAAV